MVPPSDRMAMGGPVDLRPIRPADLPDLLSLNNDHAAELSLLDARAFSALIDTAFLARCCDEASALLIALDEAAKGYESPNYLWMKARFERFVYVDRVVVAAKARGQGLARRLYDDLIVAAGDAGHQRIVCEVNTDPPNPGSDAFHASLGFAEIGRAVLPQRGKSVRYMEFKL